MNYCSHCGSAVQQSIPSGDNRLRYVCPNCHTVHYQNPNIVVGCIASWQDQVLLCRRAIEPRYGLWTVPAGFMENGETTYNGALRETLEEANARVEVQDLYITINLPDINQVYMLFRAKLLDLDFSPGAESLETKLYRAEEVPWESLAFPSVIFALQHYFEDQKAGKYMQRMADVIRNPEDRGDYHINHIFQAALDLPSR